MFLVASIYAVVGILTSALAGSAPSPQMGTVWRWSAWLLSLIAFVSHIAYEQVRLRSSVRTTAAHTAIAVALGSLALAAAGPVRSHWGAADFWRVAALSIPLWPVLTGVPAFLVALVGGSIFRRLVVRDRSVP